MMGDYIGYLGPDQRADKVGTGGWGWLRVICRCGCIWWTFDLPDNCPDCGLIVSIKYTVEK